MKNKEMTYLRNNLKFIVVLQRMTLTTCHLNPISEFKQSHAKINSGIESSGSSIKIGNDRLQCDTLTCQTTIETTDGTTIIVIVADSDQHTVVLRNCELGSKNLTYIMGQSLFDNISLDMF